MEAIIAPSPIRRTCSAVCVAVLVFATVVTLLRRDGQRRQRWKAG